MPTSFISHFQRNTPYSSSLQTVSDISVNRVVSVPGPLSFRFFAFTYNFGIPFLIARTLNKFRHIEVHYIV